MEKEVKYGASACAGTSKVKNGLVCGGTHENHAHENHAHENHAHENHALGVDRQIHEENVFR